MFSKKANCRAETTSILILAVCEIQISKIKNKRNPNSAPSKLLSLIFVNKFLPISVTTIFVKIIIEVPFPIPLLSIILLSQTINRAPATSSKVT